MSGLIQELLTRVQSDPSVLLSGVPQRSINVTLHHHGQTDGFCCNGNQDTGKSIFTFTFKVEAHHPRSRHSASFSSRTSSRCTKSSKPTFSPRGSRSGPSRIILRRGSVSAPSHPKAIETAHVRVPGALHCLEIQIPTETSGRAIDSFEKSLNEATKVVEIAGEGHLRAMTSRLVSSYHISPPSNQLSKTPNRLKPGNGS